MTLSKKHFVLWSLKEYFWSAEESPCYKTVFGQEEGNAEGKLLNRATFVSFSFLHEVCTCCPKRWKILIKGKQTCGGGGSGKKEDDKPAALGLPSFFGDTLHCDASPHTKHPNDR